LQNVILDGADLLTNVDSGSENFGSAVLEQSKRVISGISNYTGYFASALLSGASAALGRGEDSNQS
jgi:hypothetical protein